MEFEYRLKSHRYEFAMWWLSASALIWMATTFIFIASIVVYFMYEFKFIVNKYLLYAFLIATLFHIFTSLRMGKIYKYEENHPVKVGKDGYREW